MISSRKQNSAPPPQLILNGMLLAQVKNLQVHGVLLSSELSWSAHIESICTKARKVRKLVGLLYTKFYGSVNQQSLYSLYTMLLRPHLGYI